MPSTSLTSNARFLVLVTLFAGGIALVTACGPSAAEQQLATENEALQAEVDRLTSDLALALGDLSDAREEAEQAVATENEALQAEVDRLRADLARAEDELTVAQEATEEARAQVVALEEQRTELEGLGEQESSTAETPAPESSPTPGDAATPMEGSSQEPETVAEAEALLTVAEVELASARANLQLVQEDLAEVEQEREELVIRLEEAIASRDALAAELEAVQAEQQEVAGALADAEAARDANAVALEEARALAASLTLELENVLEDQRGLVEVSETQREELARIRMELEATQNEVARLSGARGIYTVQFADSLSSIATFFYRNGNRWPEILQANDNLIDDPDLIFPGMVLIVPGDD